MRSIAALVLVPLAFAGLPNLAAADDEPFMIEKRDFRKQYRVIALAPVDSDPILEMPESVAIMIEEEVTRHLEKRGYTVIPSSVLGSIRAAMTEQVGGLENPETGEVDRAKQQAVRGHSFREMWFQNEFDALATMRVSATRVRVENDSVEWDGTKQRIEREGRSGNYSARIYVSSVSFSIFDSADRPLYTNYGGLEPLMWREKDQLQPLSPDQYFLDEKKIRKAAQIAMRPI